MSFRRKKQVRTRVKHICHGCGKEFKPPSWMVSVTGTFDGKVETVYFCRDCWYWLELNDWIDPLELGAGEIRRIGGGL